MSSAPVWVPGFTTKVWVSAGNKSMLSGDIPYTLEDYDTLECPVSLISIQSNQMVTQFANADIVREAAGTNPMGDTSQWSGRMTDAVAHLSSFKAELDIARQEREQSYRQ